MNYRISLLIFFIFFTHSFTWSQNKKERLERMKSTIDSMTKYILATNKHFEDSLFFERLNATLQKDTITQQRKQINHLLVEANELRSKDLILEQEIDSLKKLIEKNLTNEGLDFSEKQFFTLCNDVPILINQNNEYKEIMNDFKRRFFKYPEKNVNEQFNVPSHSKLTETEIWWQGDTSFALTVVKDVHMIIEAGGVAIPEISLNYYVLKYKNNHFEKEFTWEKKLEPCHLDSDNSNINFQITDINSDGNFEIWCVNENYCNGGINANHLYVYMYQNGELYTMKSATNYPDFDITDETIREWSKDEEDPYFSINEFDSKFLSISPIYREYAIRLRNENILGETLRKIR